LAELDRSNVVDVDLGSAEFKANAHRYMAEWGRRRPFYVLGNGPPQVVVGRYADVHRVFSDTDTFKSEMPRGPRWEQFNKIMFAQFVTQMDGEQHARVRRLLMPAFSSRRIEQLQDGITRIVDGMLDRIEANGPEFDGMQDYGAHLVVDALLDAIAARRSSSRSTMSSQAPPTSSRASRGPRNCGAPSIAPWKKSRPLSKSGA
jgi:cytochrome P450